MSARTRRTIPGTIGPSGAYSPSMFEEHPAPPAPLALFDPSAHVVDVEPVEAYRAPCVTCGGETERRPSVISRGRCHACVRAGHEALSMDEQRADFEARHIARLVALHVEPAQ